VRGECLTLTGEKNEELRTDVVLIMTKRRGVVVLLVAFLCLTFNLQAQISFSANLNPGGVTSAGIFNSQGRLVRTLWAMEVLPAGDLTASWDGLDDFGSRVPTGSYTWKVIRNGSTYANLSTIGNTGRPSYTVGHVPFFLEGVGLDSAGNAYTVHGWDEAHFDVIEWSLTDGQAIMNTGHCVSEALLKAIAVEPDGSYAYVTAASNSDDRNEACFSIYRINMAPGLYESERTVNFTQRGRCIKVYDGSRPGYPNAGPPNYPTWATAADKEVMKEPLISIAVQAGSIYVTDALGGRILRYDKVSGNHQQTITGLPVACGLAIAPDGKIWVGHEHTKVSVYNGAGTRLGTPISNLTEVRSLSIQTVAGTRTLCVADRVGRIRKYRIGANGTSVSQLSTFGLSQRTGDWTSARMLLVNGMAMDSSGNIVVLDHMGDGSRMQKLNAQYAQLWAQMCLEFSSSLAYSRANPNVAFSSYRQAYQLDRATGNWTHLGVAKTDSLGRYFGNFDSSHAGPPHVVRLGADDFFYFPAGDSLAVYRVVPGVNGLGPTLKLASVLGGSGPGPDGLVWTDKYLWDWHDTQGDGQIQYTPRSTPGAAGEVNLVAVGSSPDPNWKWPRDSYEVDDSGRVWIASNQRAYVPDTSFLWEGTALYATPVPSLNTRGNPIYRWNAAVKVTDDMSGRNALALTAGEGFSWKMVGQSTDASNVGMVYGLAWSDKPGLPQNGLAWMGGNVLFGFQQSNPTSLSFIATPSFCVPLPKTSVGMRPIPGGAGGALVGIDPERGTVGHYTKEGLLIGSMNTAFRFRDLSREPWVVGGLDSYLAVNCNRAPDGLFDVFVEDNLNQRVVWYRVDDSNIQTADSDTISSPAVSGGGYLLTVNNGIGDGRYLDGVTVNLSATLDPAKIFMSWTGAIVTNPLSPNTTLTMPANDTTVTANYAWATGNDKVRFFPKPGEEHRLQNCIFEGTNGDRINGPYTTFFVVPNVPSPGWSEFGVNMQGYRCVRWRDPNGNGLVAELEFWRNGVKITGTTFGTAGSWQDNGRTYPQALDGNTSTYFEGPRAGSHPYIGIDSNSAPAAADPNFTPAPGAYPGEQLVYITSATPGASIRYTTDGSTPSSTTGTVYGGPLSIGSATTLKAIAYKAGMSNSTITTGAYTINNGTSGMGFISREVWTGTGGTSVASIPLGTPPSLTDTLPSFEAPVNWADNYGTRLRGYLTPPATGNYTFWIASDDNSELWLSMNDNPTNKLKIAWVLDYTDSRQWNKFASQKAEIWLEQGRRYYIEALQKEAGGGDNLAVGWAKPDEATSVPSQVIPGSALSPFNGVTPAPEITVYGNATPIADGDTTPSASDHTDFGSTVFPGGTVTRTFTIQNIGAVTLTVGPVTLSGKNAADFSVIVQPSNSVPAGGSTTFQARFSPGAVGTRTASLSIGNNDVNENPYDFALQATGATAASSISREVWTGVSGTTVANIPVGAAPNIADTLSSFEAPTNWADNYGTRLRGYITAPATGDYTFWIASDDNSELWLAMNDNPTNKVKIAWVLDYTDPRQWNKFASQKAEIALEQGQRYYIEALQKEGGGGDNLAVGWVKPGDASSVPEVIPGFVLSPYGASP
jgi:Chitobiase/beta-hexosaminidase C-terminal domain/PA14 domain/Divergent InlB B-repeat domain/HYDIN/CFA65/VesB-like, Ig-like domain/FlgD Ig-like domain